ncbi:hypothetical protein [Methyloligella solikamskensis]|uniref:Uncharacterized protein n=1 Tax=Methyloligella solikamskensis TaxID=1177756 RepID=A0ABW3JBC0_9HYPH
MKLKSLLLAGCVALAPAAAVAGGASLSGDELRSAVSGKTVYLRISGFELPIQYSANGSMRGRMGSVAASFAGGESPTDAGTWWVKGDQLCQKWNSWMEGQSYCYRLSKSGSTVNWVRNDGRSGTARISG